VQLNGLQQSALVGAADESGTFVLKSDAPD